MDTYVLYAASINGSLISGVKSQRIGANIQKRINNNDGSPRSRYVAVMSRESTISFSTVEIVSLLTATGMEGVAISSTVVLFFQKTAANGQRASGTSHVKMTISSGLVVPRPARGSQGEEAEIGCEIFPVSSDGATDPITIADSQALSGTPNVSQKFTVGPASFNGTAVETQSVEVDPGIEVVSRSHHGYYLPVHCFVRSVRPKVRVTTMDAGVLASIGLTGLAQDGTDSFVYFRKLAEGSTRTAELTAEHAKFTLDEGHFHVDSAEASEDGDAMATIEYDATYDGTNAPVVFAAAAI